MSSLILNVNSNSSGGSGGGDTANNEKNVTTSKDSIVVSAAIPSQESKVVRPEVSTSSSMSIEAKCSVSSANNPPSVFTSSHAGRTTLPTHTKIEVNSSQSLKSTTALATVVVTAPPQTNASSPIFRQTGALGTTPVSTNSAATTVITAVPLATGKPLPMTTLTQQMTPKLPQQPSPKISTISISTNNQATIATNQSTTVIGQLRNSLHPPISFNAVTRPHQLTIPNVNSGKQSSPSPTITLSPIKPQGPQGAALVSAIQSSQAQHNPSGTVLVSNNSTGSGTTILATHRQLHTVTTQSQRQLQHTVVHQQPSSVTRVAPTLITGHAPGTHHHVVQHHPPPLRMVQLPAGAASVTGGAQNLTTRIAVSGSGSLSSHVPPTTVSLPQSPAPIAIRHALPQSPLARNSPLSNAGVCSQLPKSPVRHLQPQLPQTPVAGGANQPTTLLTTSRSVHSAPPAHLSSASIITHHPQQSGNTVVNRTALPLASVLASANQQRHLQQQLVTQRVLSTGPGGTTATVVQGLQQPHPGLGAHSLSQTGTGTIMVNPHRPGTISMLPQVPASGTITAGGLIVHHPSSGGNANLLGNPAQSHHTLSGNSHQLVSFPSNTGSNQVSSNQRITLPTGNMLAHINGAQQHGGVLTVSCAMTTPGNNVASPSTMSSNLTGRQIVATALSKSSTTILPPNALQQLLASHPQQQMEDDLDVTELDGHHVNSYKYQSPNSPVIGISRGGAAGVTLNTGRTTLTLPSPRQQHQVQHQRDRRSLPCQLALQDHNYYSRPPPTPPPPQSPPILRDVLQEQQRRQQQLHQSFSTSPSPFSSVLAAAEVHHQQQQLSTGTKQTYVVGNSLSSDHHSSPSPTTNRSAFSPPLQAPNNLRSPVNSVPQNTVSPHANKVSSNGSNSGSIVRLPQYTPDSQKFAAAMVAAVTSPPMSGKKHSPHYNKPGLVTAINGPTSSDKVNSALIGKTVHSRVDAHFRSIQEAGVGPMAPLVDDIPSDGESLSPTNEMDRDSNEHDLDEKDDGEETETAPEAEGEDDSITRCICDFLHDDGYMICCDKCLVWQHVVCMGLDRNNIPDEYLCEVCKPRPIDRKRAKSMQARRRSELYQHSSSSDDSGGNRTTKNKPKTKGLQKMDKKNNAKSSLASMKRILDKKIDRVTNKDIASKKNFSSKMSKKSAAQTLAMLNNKGANQSSFPSSTMIPQQLLPANLIQNSLNVLEGNNGNALSPLSPINTSSKLKKQYRKRKLSDKDLKKPASINTSSAFAKGRRKSQQIKKQQNRNRRRSIDSDGGGDIDASTDEDENPTIEETKPDASQQLRSWIDQYEEAVTNHYSPELRARLVGAGKLGGGISNGDLKPSVIGSMTRCNVSLQGNGVKILTASNNLSGNTPIIECKGKLMLGAQYRNANRKSPGQGENSNTPLNPYVLFYQLSETLEICLDGKTYGNDSRFCRRSSNDYNAELRHVIDKGSLHLFIITLKSVEKNQEILLPPDSSCYPQESSPLPSINADLREITMKSSKPVTNGIISPTTSPPSSRSSDLDESTPLSSTRNRQGEDNTSKLESVNRQNTKPQKEKRKFPKLVLKSPKKSKSINSKENKANHITSVNKPKIKKGNEELGSSRNARKNSMTRAEDKNIESNSAEETDLGQESIPNSPTKYGSAKPSPGKLGLPDNSGLIVGVNTINYDASSELKNKAKSREERKMEMIMKAFEAMERAEQKKKETHGTTDQGVSITGGYQSVRGSTDSDKSTSVNKRRRSSAKDIGRANNDSNVDASSAEDMANDDTDDADEEEMMSGGKKRVEKFKKKSLGRNKNRKSTAPNTPKRRRSRISSGGSGSATEDISVSNARENSQESASTASTNNQTSSNSQNGPFRFPKTKKTLMSDWLQETNEASRSPNPAFCDDDDVSANYLKGSRSPPGIAMHLLRSSIGSNATTAPLSPNIPSPHSPVKTGGNHVCSAKKRWLRQAISEDHAPGEILSPVHEVAFLMNGNSPLSSGESGVTGNCTINDYVTPLKKRRLQSYKNEQKFLEEEENASSEENLVHSRHPVSTHSEFTSKISTSYNSYPDDVKVLPNGIKKKLLHNLVLEAVLDRAMEDMLNVRPKSEIDVENTEIEMTTTSGGLDVKQETNEELNIKHEIKSDVTDSISHEEEDIKVTEDGGLEVVDIGMKHVVKTGHSLNILEEQQISEEKITNETEICTNKVDALPDTKVNPAGVEISAFSSTSNIPEPSSVFKSFFKSSVSIEALEAQLEETKKLREAEQKQLEQLTAKQREEELGKQNYQLDTKLEDKSNHILQEQHEYGSKVILEDMALSASINIVNTTPQAANTDAVSSSVTHTTDVKLSREVKDNAEIIPPEKFVTKSLTSLDVQDGYGSHVSEIAESKSKELIENIYLPADGKKSTNEEISQTSMESEINQDHGQYSGIEKNSTILPPSIIDINFLTHTDPPKPKEKRKVSLADYKRRRQQQQQLTTTSSDATVSPLLTSIKQSPTEISGKSTKKASDCGVHATSDNSLDSLSPGILTGDIKSKDLNTVEVKQIETQFQYASNIAEETPDQPDANSIANHEQVSDDIGGGTPTMDEDQMAPESTVISSSIGITDLTQSTTSAPITLNTLPLFEKLEKLEKAQKENKKKALGNASPPPEPKREDLTERLKKEFGLTVDADDDDDIPTSEEVNEKTTLPTNVTVTINEGDATPEEDSPQPPASMGSGSSLSSIHRHPTMTRLPDQMAQYPTQSAPTYNSSVSQSTVDNTSHTPLTTKGQLNSSYSQNTQSGQTTRYSSHSQQTRGPSYQHSTGSHSQTQQNSYQRHPPPPSRSHLPVNHPGSRMTYPPPLPPASVIANAPHPNKINSEREMNMIKSSSNNFKRSNSSKEKEYYGPQHTWSSERDSRTDRDREPRSSSGNNRSYYASTTSRGISDRNTTGSRSIGSSNYGGDKISSSRPEYNRREYSQIRSASSSERIGSHGSATSLGTDRDLRGGGSEHVNSSSSRSSSTNNSSRSSKSCYSRSSYYNN